MQIAKKLNAGPLVYFAKYASESVQVPAKSKGHDRHWKLWPKWLEEVAAFFYVLFLN